MVFANDNDCSAAEGWLAAAVGGERGGEEGRRGEEEEGGRGRRGVALAVVVGGLWGMGGPVLGRGGKEGVVEKGEGGRGRRGCGEVEGVSKGGARGGDGGGGGEHVVHQWWWWGGGRRERGLVAGKGSGESTNGNEVMCFPPIG